MKLCLFLLLISTVSLVASNSYSQNAKFSINLKDATLRELIEEIENQSEFIFVFYDDLVDLDEKISINVTNKTIDKILNLAFESSKRTYRIYDRQIAFGKKASLKNEVVMPQIDLLPVQQEKTITGKVTDEKGTTIPGATVVIKGTTIGTITDVEGLFNLSVPEESKLLVVSFVGYQKSEIVLGSLTHFNITLIENIVDIEEVVAIGYGTAKKRDLTGSVVSVSGNTLKNIPVSSAADAISGRMAGVQVTRTEGSPDADIKIRIRGGGSLTQDNSPLYLVDGFPVDNLNGIAPTDIESIDVLKDASSTSIYGARGANGVIIVTTKGGFEGKGKVSYNTYYGVKNIVNYQDVFDPYDFVLYQLETIGLDAAELAFGDVRDYDLYKEMPGTNWQERILGETGTSQYHNLSFSGGTKTSKYNISVTSNDEKEIMIGSGYNRTNLTANMSQKVNNWLTVDLNTRLSDTRIKGMGTSSNYSRLSSIVQYRPVEGIQDFTDTDDGTDLLYDLYVQNPENQTNDDYRRRTTRSFDLNGAAKAQLTKNLSFRLSYGVNFYQNINKMFYGPYTYESMLKGEQPIVQVEDTDSKRIRLSNTLVYTKKDFIPGHNLTVMGGQELNNYQKSKQTDKSTYFPASIDPVSALSNMQLGTPDPTTIYVSPDDKVSSFFGRLNYDYKGRYLFSGTLRADGSSKFATGNQWGYFPSAGIAWRVSDENFMKSTTGWLNDLKLRASFGEAGNNRISDNAWEKTFYVSNGNLYKEGDETTQTSYFKANSILSNKKLKWETTVTKNLGLDFRLFDSRLTGSVEAYHNVTKDLLIQASIPSQTGYSSQWQNIGQTSNKGLEFLFEAAIVEKKDFRITASFNIGFNRNNVDKLGETKTMEVASSWGGSACALNDYILEEGSPTGQMYGYETLGMYSFDDFNAVYNEGSDSWDYTLKEGVSDNLSLIGFNNSTLLPGALKLKDQNGDLVVDTEDRVVIGNANPKHTGGFNLSTQYKDFDLSAFFNWVYGNDIYNANKLRWSSYLETRKYRNLSSDMDGYFRYTSPETGETISDPTALAELNKDAKIWSPKFTNARLHSWAIEDGSFLRLSTLTVGYSLPKRFISKINIDRLRFYATGYNLWTWTNYTGFDPEVDSQRSTPLTPGVDYQAYPRSRSFIFGLNVEF
jgi:TonB-linked SusC/RagA family outer membrane protein